MWQRTDLAQVKRDRHTGKPQKAGSTKAFRLRQSILSAEMRRKRLSLPTGEVRPSEHDYDYKEFFDMTTKGIYHTLVTQLDKLARHNRQGSFRTKDRYYEAVKRFCAYLAAHYHLQKLENISGKHLVSYVLYLQEQGKSASTIKTDLSAIRFFHDKMSQPRYALPGNEDLGVALERRRFGQQDRTWTNPEFGKLIGRAMAEEGEDYILALYLARYPLALGHYLEQRTEIFVERAAQIAKTIEAEKAFEAAREAGCSDSIKQARDLDNDSAIKLLTAAVMRRQTAAK